MKTLSKILIGLMIPLFMMVIQIVPVKASPQEKDLTYNSAAEEYIRNELLLSGEANLAQSFEDEAQRIIRAEFIVELFNDPAFQELPFVKIYNATIKGDMKADGLHIPFNLVFDGCKFTGRIELSRASIRSFNMYNSHVAGSVRLGRAIIEEDLALYSSTYEGAVILFGADIGGSFHAANSKFNGTVADKDTAYPFELWTTRVAKTIELRNSIIKGDAMFEGAIAEENMFFEGAVFEKTSNFKDIYVGDFAGFQNTVFQESVTFESDIVGRDANFSNAIFNGDVDFDYFAAERFVDFDGAVFNRELSFKYASIGWPDFSSSTFNGSVDFTGIQVANDLNFSSSSYNYAGEAFTISLANVAGSVLLDGITSPAGVRLTDNKFGGLMIDANGQNLAIIDLTSTKIDGSLSVENASVREFYAVEITAAEATVFKQLHVENILDMSNAKIGFFTMNQFSWPQTPEAFNLRGLVYADISLGERELTDETWTEFLDMIEKSAYSPQAYQTLAQFLTEKGHPDWAAQVAIAQKNRERDQILEPRSAPWAWSWFLFLFSGYGQRPFLAFVWSALVIGTGCLVFRKEEDLVLLEDNDAKPEYSAFLYSLDLFLPYIELGIAGKWDPKPERKFSWTYKHVHRLLGWILMPIALLTFGGII